MKGIVKTIRHFMTSVFHSVTRSIETKKNKDEELINRKKMLAEISQAHQEWHIAQERMNYALTAEQVDYAIYYMEAAQKRYEILLRAAKKQQVIGSWKKR